MKKLFFLLMAVAVSLYSFAVNDAVSVKFDADQRGVELSNGLVTMHVNAEGSIESIRYAGTDVLIGGKENTAYLSYVTDELKSGLKADATTVIQQSDDIVEVVWSNSKPTRSLHWKVGYIMKRGIAGYWSYAIVKAREDSKGRFDNGLHEARIVYRLNPDVFNYAWVNDNSQAPMPSTADLANPQETIQDATFRVADGSIYTKYDWATYVKDDQLHGLMGDNIGAWLISPSVDWVNGGVQKQELTVHGDTHSPLILQMFQSNHFGGVPTRFEREHQKMYGPAMVYFNQGCREQMISDAKKRCQQEISDYPYQWLKNDLFPLKRATVKGQITIDKTFGTNRFQVILAKPGGKPMEQGDAYQYWAETDNKGNYTIDNVREGEYALYAYALNGEATGIFEHDGITIKAGKQTIPALKWEPEKYGKTLWRIGESDRLTAGTKFSDLHRAYHICKDVPAELTYTIGKSALKDDWYYAQTKNGNWNIEFDCNETFTEPLRLTIALAGAAGRVKENIFVNGKNIGIIRTENDGGVYRSALLSGKDALYTFDIQPDLIKQGKNTITLELWGIPEKNLGGIMYDCIKLEAK